MTNYAVLIGNSQFTPEAELSALTSPPQDVAGLAAELKAEGRGLFTDITLLVNKSSSEIKKSLIKILKDAGKDDLVLLYYSGHGLPNKNDLFLATADTERDYLETTAVSFEEIYRWIKSYYCQKIVILLDCCYSGVAGNRFKGDLESQLKILNDQVTSTCLMTASSNDQVALDRAEGGYSLFTKHLINGIHGAADCDSSGQITLDELFRYVNKHVTEECPTQIPKRFLNNENGELILAKSGRDNRKERMDKLWDYLHDLSKGKRITSDILAESLRIIDKPLKDLSEAEKEKDNLISQCIITKDPLHFALEWKRLDYAAQANSKQIEATKQAELAQQAESKCAFAEERRAFAAMLTVIKDAKEQHIQVEEAKRAAAQRDKEKKEAIAKQTELEQRRCALEQQAARPVPPPFVSSTPSSNWYPQIGIGVVVLGSVLAGWFGLSGEKPAPPAIISEDEMISIPAGDFVMGCQDGRDNECEAKEKPTHTVSIPVFKIGRTEVTVAQFRSFVNATHYQTTEEKQGSCWSLDSLGRMVDVKGNSWRKPGFSQTDNDPVACVSWEDSQAMIAWLIQTTGRGYRLPSESEWEYACRAGQNTNYCGENDVNAVAWYGAAYPAFNHTSGKTTNPVQTKQPNAFGLYDMSGNVWEWVQDSWHDSYINAPSDGSVWEAGGDSTRRVLRGGSWDSHPKKIRAAHRDGDFTSVKKWHIGFRLARTLP